MMTLCNLACLLNVLDFRTYSPPGRGPFDVNQQARLLDSDYNSMDYVTRCASIYARSFAMMLMDWFGASYAVSWVDSETDKVEWVPAVRFVTRYLASQCRSVVEYKERTEEAKTSGAAKCPSAAIRRQVKGLFAFVDTKLRDILAEAFEDSANGPSSWMCFPTLPGKYEFGGYLPYIRLEDFDVVHNPHIKYEGNSFSCRLQWGCSFDLAFDVQPIGFSMRDKKYLDFLVEKLNLASPGPFDKYPTETLFDDDDEDSEASEDLEDDDNEAQVPMKRHQQGGEDGDVRRKRART